MPESDDPNEGESVDRLLQAAQRLQEEVRAMSAAAPNGDVAVTRARIERARESLERVERLVPA